MALSTVYLVSTGDYSDYQVHCVFERREDAEAYIAARERREFDRAVARRADTECTHMGYEGHRDRLPIGEHTFDEWLVCRGPYGGFGGFVEERQFWPAGVIPTAEGA